MRSRTRSLTPTRTRRALGGWARRMLPGEARDLVLLSLLTLVLGVLLWFFPVVLPLMLLVVPLVIGSVFLSPRRLPWFVVYVLLVLAVVAPRQPILSTRVLIATAAIRRIPRGGRRRGPCATRRRTAASTSTRPRATT